MQEAEPYKGDDKGPQQQVTLCILIDVVKADCRRLNLTKEMTKDRSNK